MAGGGEQETDLPVLVVGVGWVAGVGEGGGGLGELWAEGWLPAATREAFFPCQVVGGSCKGKGGCSISEHHWWGVWGGERG